MSGRVETTFTAPLFVLAAFLLSDLWLELEHAASNVTTASAAKILRTDPPKIRPLAGRR
jgi:hypothetical protein